MRRGNLERQAIPFERSAEHLLYSLISIAVVRPILTFFLVYELGLGLYGAWIALTLDQTTRAVCSMLGSRQTIRIKMKDSSNS